MIQHLRSRLRIVVATAICALVAAPALVAGTTSIAAAAPPGVNNATLTVNGEGTGLANNTWNFDGGGYDQLKAALKDPANFGSSGVVKKGSFAVPAAPITTGLSFPGTLSNLDVFFGGLPTSEYSAGEIAALQAFNADGRALVLNSNAPGFGELATWLGFTMRANRAFFGNDGVCWNNSGAAGAESAASKGTAVGSFPAIQTGVFGAAPTVSNYHTVEVFTGLPAQAQAVYNLSITGQAPQLAVIGPIGETSTAVAPITHVSYQAAYVTGNITISTAALSPSQITSVAFYHDSVLPANLISTDTTYPFETTWNTAAALPLGVADGTHPVIAHVVPTVGAPFDAQLDFGVNVHNTAPVPPPNTANINYDCPGATDQVENNIAGTTVAVIPPHALSANSGPIVVTSDLDAMSNAFDTSWSENRTFALNAFAWVMDNMLPDVPPVPDDTYFPLANPVRVYDSRQTGPLGHANTRAIPVAGLDGVPADAKTVLANVTVVDPDSSGYFTVFPTGQAQPNTSTHNFDAGENFANMVSMQVGSGGSISVFAFLNSGGGTVDVLVDVVGYTRSDNSGTRLHTMDPIRLLDTRVGTGLPQAPFGAGTPQNLTVRGGSTGVPSDAESVVLNMTVTNATHTGSFVTVWPAGSAQPNVSNLNNVEGVARPNLVVARIGAGGQISIANDSGTADILADVVGYFSAGAYKSGGVITGLPPVRILDTRPANAFAAGQVRSLTVAGVGGIPGTAKTAILKITAVDPTTDGFITVWPAGSANPPNVSNLNFGAGMTIPNLVITRIGTGGQINIYNALGTTHVLVDVLGYAD